MQRRTLEMCVLSGDAQEQRAELNDTGRPRLSALVGSFSPALLGRISNDVISARSWAPAVASQP